MDPVLRIDLDQVQLTRGGEESSQAEGRETRGINSEHGAVREEGGQELLTDRQAPSSPVPWPLKQTCRSGA